MHDNARAPAHYGSHTIPPNELPWDEAIVRRELQKTFASPSYRPPSLPEVALKVMDLSRQPDVPISDLARVLEGDQLLAARVLQLSQSSIYGRQPVQTLQQAIMRLGVVVMRDVIFEASVTMRVFKAPNYVKTMTELRRHSVATAHFSRVVCRYTSMDAEYAFSCGLLHDVGIAASLVAVSDMPNAKDRAPLEEVWLAIRGIHEECSKYLARLWGLPPDVQFVLGAHHAFGNGAQVHPLAVVIALAEGIAVEHGLGVGMSLHMTEASDDLVVQRAAMVLKLSDKQLELIRASCAKLLTEIDL